MQNKTAESKTRLLNNLRDFPLGCQNTTVYVPITTNKLKELCKECLDFYNIYKKNEKVTLKILYRITLAQLTYQLGRSETVQTSSLPDCYKVNKKNRKWFYEHESQMSGYNTNFFPLAHLINSVGVYAHDGIDFQAHIPPAIEESGQTIPDPFKVSMVNLYEFVCYLSKPDTDREIRKYFRKYDPLPDAEWTDDDVLINPFAIIPENYNPRKDYLELQLCFDHKIEYLFSKCKFNGKGSAIQLINVAKYDTYPEVETSCSYVVKDEMLHNLAACFMIGERPPNFIKEPKDIWDFRYSELGSYTFKSCFNLRQLMQQPKNFLYSSDSDSDY